ncbi:DegV family protein [Eggerthellaceae bacterium zg-1084]|uniref:DegV family protein n=1 Tax=Berryella wangjianweii TaxID=2734634 RepID=UPI001553BA93|nr:DegV family protein [Berryella wangjianweii]NPD30549.1 DegV family protein [Berryella wangjianweii]NPD32234.1 DegV family protein [Eggerthellaceae bacterium zg-997]
MVRIVTDSVTGLTAEEARRYDVEVLTLFINRDGVEYVETELDIDEFYSQINTMIDDIPTSSQPSQHAFEEAFERIARDGDELLGIFMSAGLSGTYEGAIRAARSVAARNPGFRFRVIDSTSVSFDEVWPLLRAVAARDAGASLDVCAQECLDGMASTRYLFVPESLAFLRAGGRIGGAAAFLGGLVKILPVLSVRDGFAVTVSKARTRSKAVNAMLTHFKNDIAEHGVKNVMVHYIGDKTEAVRWAREVVEPLVGQAVGVRPASPVIGVHVGPAVGIAYECVSRIKGKLTKPDSSYVCSA